MSQTLAELIAAGQAGDEKAQRKASDIVKLELQRRKRRYNRRTSHSIVNTTIRIGDQIDWNECRQYLVRMAEQSRQVLIEQAKHRSAQQDGSNVGEDNYPAVDVIAIDAALSELASKDATIAEVMLHRYFGGHDNAEIAAIMDLPHDDADALVQFGKATLARFTRLHGARHPRPSDT